MKRNMFFLWKIAAIAAVSVSLWGVHDPTLTGETGSRSLSRENLIVKRDLGRLPAYLPVRHWKGEKFIFLPDGRTGARQRTGYTRFARGPNGPDAWTESPPYEELAGRVAVVSEVRDLGDKLLLRFRMEDTGEVYSSFLFPSLSLASPPSYEWQRKGIPGIGPLSDLEYALNRIVGKTFLLNGEEILMLEPFTDDVVREFVGRSIPVTVIDAEPGWDSESPVRLIVRTERGETGFLDVSVSGTNVSEDYRDHTHIHHHLFVPEYSTLLVARLSADADAVHVEGVTDLPEGSELMIAFDSAVPVKGERERSGRARARVRNGRFNAEFTPADGYGGWGADCDLTVSFSPEGQRSEVTRLTGARGESLTGPSSWHYTNGLNVLLYEEKKDRKFCLRLTSGFLKKGEEDRLQFVDRLRDRFAEEQTDVDVFTYGKHHSGIGFAYESFRAWRHDDRWRTSWMDEIRRLGFQKVSFNYGKREYFEYRLIP